MTDRWTGDVWVVVDHRFGEIEDSTLRLLTRARALADQSGAELAAVVLGESIGGLVSELGRYGAQRVYLAESSLLRFYNSDAYTKTLVALIRHGNPSIVLYSAGLTGSDLAPRLAARLNSGLASECSHLALDESGQLTLTRPAYGGKVSSTVTFPSGRPQMATIRAAGLPATPVQAPRQPEVVQCEIDLNESDLRTRVEGFTHSEPAEMQLEEADVIVAGGRGVGGEENFRLLEELAKVLGGAVAASRAAVDNRWAPYHRQVGQSGKTVRPRLYIACGISGATYHTMGMKDSKAIIAVNTDKSAPILKLANVGIVGDLLEVVPRTTERLRAMAEAKGKKGMGQVVEAFAEK